MTDCVECGSVETVSVRVDGQGGRVGGYCSNCNLLTVDESIVYGTVEVINS